MQITESLFRRRKNKNKNKIQITDVAKERLNEIYKQFEGLQLATDPNTNQTILVARGKVSDGNNEFTPLTSISVRPSTDQENLDVEFATGVGELINSNAGAVAINELNKRFRGKFVALESEQPTRINVIYNERSPAESVDSRERLFKQLVAQGKTIAAVSPLLEKLNEKLGATFIDPKIIERTASTVDTKVSSEISGDTTPIYHLQDKSSSPRPGIIANNDSDSAFQVQQLQELHEKLKGFQPARNQKTGQPLLVARGRISRGGKFHEPRTAIAANQNPTDGSYEFRLSTKVGDLPSTETSLVTVNELNKRFRGKFVAVDSDQADRLDLIYDERTQKVRLENKRQLLRELVAQGQTLAIVKPVLDDVEIQLGKHNPIDETVEKETEDIVRQHFHFDSNQDYITE